MWWAKTLLQPQHHPLPSGSYATLETCNSGQWTTHTLLYAVSAIHLLFSKRSSELCINGKFLVHTLSSIVFSAPSSPPPPLLSPPPPLLPQVLYQWTVHGTHLVVWCFLCKPLSYVLVKSSQYTPYCLLFSGRPFAAGLSFCWVCLIWFAGFHHVLPA